MANAAFSASVEEWRVVPSMPEIEASSFGRIRRKSHEGQLPLGRGVRMYHSQPTYGVIRSAKKTAKHTYRGYNYRGIGNIKVHRMVCEAFHDPAPAGMPYVLHVDENAHNNRPENLKWGTQKENLNMPVARVNNASSRSRILVSLDGKLMGLTEASSVSGIKRSTLWDRIIIRRLPEAEWFGPVRQIASTMEWR
jgi:hypothetical protein